MGYLQHIQIEKVEEVGVETVMPQYQQIVNVVEVIDQDGNPWEPVPGPDPWDELVKVTGTTTSGTPSIGSTLTGTLAVYTGGVPPVQHLYQWQRSDTGTGNWSGATNWTEISTYNPTEQSYTLVEGDLGKYMRFGSKAIDDDGTTVYGSGNNVGPVYDGPLVVSTPSATGDAIVGETLTCSVPTVSGALEPYTISYMWANADTHSIVFEQRYLQRTLVLTEEDDGISYYCQVTVTSADGQSETVVSNSLGPVLIPLFGTLTATVDGNPYDLISPPTLTTGNSSTHTLAVSYSGNALNPNYNWEVRQGQARIAGGGASVTVTMESVPPAGVQIQCNIRDDNASDSPVNYRTLFYVSD